ncbi:MAG: hypothetical protein IJ298_02020 [Ruminococcus sp.]|nr:hypothetical protein [Ruminococcus sp.]
MDINSEKEMYCREVAIAEQAIDNAGLEGTLKNKTKVCDIYCAVSLEHQTFFAQIYEDSENYYIVYAKTYAKTNAGEFTTLLFSVCEKLRKYPEVFAKILCDVKILPKNDKFICKLMGCLPVSDRWSEPSGLLIDGVLTVMRSFYRGRLCATLGFRYEEELDTEVFSLEQRHFLENLHIIVAEVINGGDII